MARRPRNDGFDRGDGELHDKLVSINRVAKVVKGGRRFGFSALVVVGDQKGRVGFGHGKAREVPEAIRKATEQAKRTLIRVPLREGRTLHHIRMTSRDGLVQHIYLDPETALESRIVTEGPTGDVEQRLLDFREVDGLLMPFTVEVLTGGTVTGRMKILKVELNPTVDISLFRIPR